MMTLQHHQHNIYQVNGAGVSGGLSQAPQTFPHFLAPENIHRRLEEMGGWKTRLPVFLSFLFFPPASSVDQKHKKKDEIKKTIFVKTTTTKPPIVWFPGDPDCGEGDLGGNSRLDTFQLIAFLLSAFNIAAIMASNVNNNNNNNNINDNEGNYNF